MKKSLLIIIVVALIIVVCIGLYFLFFASKPTTQPGGQAGSLPGAGTQHNPSNGLGNLPPSTTTAGTGSGKNFGVISKEPVLDYFVNSANVVTAIEPDGKIVQVTNGQVSTINSLLVQNILSASFSSDGAKILVSFGDSANPQTSLFDVAAKAWTPVKQGLLSPAWSPSDERFVYYTTTVTGSETTETFAMLDASKLKAAPVTLITLHAQDLSVTWPTKNQVVFYTKPSAYALGSAWNFDLKTKTLTPIASELPGLSIAWNTTALTSSSPSALEFSANPSGFGGAISLIDPAGSIMHKLQFVTLTSKCLFASGPSASSTSATTPYLYCSVPRDQGALSAGRLPDDYSQMAFFTSDDIYRINLQNGAIETLMSDPSRDLDASDVKSFNNTLFFVNRYDKLLYGVGL